MQDADDILFCCCDAMKLFSLVSGGKPVAAISLVVLLTPLASEGNQTLSLHKHE